MLEGLLIQAPKFSSACPKIFSPKLNISAKKISAQVSSQSFLKQIWNKRLLLFSTETQFVEKMDWVRKLKQLLDWDWLAKNKTDWKRSFWSKSSFQNFTQKKRTKLCSKVEKMDSENKSKILIYLSFYSNYFVDFFCFSANLDFVSKFFQVSAIILQLCTFDNNFEDWCHCF